ncbi:MAG TPA: hypothetical protein DEP48_04760 [Persephonella sp.]|uniref:Uncharacterized protein n=1 Tax=Persephonella marina (strain DSM 14350 / EX-H1) TaxID=123214 RepID=C0QPZ1_PERMH|nr:MULTISPECIES: hypothetical protein [Persephonella]ACO03730.1 hypothetical protein PERMA_0950 [Persephonella marina EX-H1]HCB69648.1 hypothetical protein [Persephonella sp.]
MLRIFFIFTLIFSVSYAFQIPFKWGSGSSDIKGIEIYKRCDGLEVYIKDRIKGYSADRVLLYFYNGKLYKVSIRYSSFYDFLGDIKSITGRAEVYFFSIQRYEVDGTVVKIIHTPFSNRIDFINSIYEKRAGLIERCLTK